MFSTLLDMLIFLSMSDCSKWQNYSREKSYIFFTKAINGQITSQGNAICVLGFTNWKRMFYFVCLIVWVGKELGGIAYRVGYLAGTTARS